MGISKHKDNKFRGKIKKVVNKFSKIGKIQFFGNLPTPKF